MRKYCSDNLWYLPEVIVFSPSSTVPKVNEQKVRYKWENLPNFSHTEKKVQKRDTNKNIVQFFQADAWRGGSAMKDRQTWK